MRRKVVNVETVRVATSSTTPDGAVPLPHAPAAPGDGKGVGDTPQTVKPGEKIVVEAMREALYHNKVMMLKMPRNSGKVAALELMIEAQQKEIEGLRAALKQKLLPAWRRFREDPPEPRQLIAMAEYSRISRRWAYWATRLERDAVEFWKSSDSDVRWAPLPELLVGDEEPEVKA